MRISADSSHLQTGYRPDIDGLRAIAVMAVVGYHAFPGRVPGGFTGVDVFFVISGYLITSIIRSQLLSGRFSFLDFYLRRVRRLFPALLLVLSCVLAFGWFSLFANEYERVALHVVAAASYVSNFVLWHESGYFDRGSELKPLLHLWSLAIEEQFYLLWPVAFFLAIRHRIHLNALCVLVALASFFLNIYLTWKHPSAAFYFSPARFWELMAGALLAQPSISRSRILKGHGDKMVILGLAMIFMGLFFVDKGMKFPGWLALLPVCGAMLSILGCPSSRIGRKVLGWPPLVWIGLLSYPLYLWHWPILVYARILSNGEPSQMVRIAAVGAAFVLAWATFAFIERPIRTAQTKHALATLLASGTAVFILGLALFATAGLPWRGVNTTLALSAVPGADSIGRNDPCEKQLGFGVGLESACAFNSPLPKVLIVGDSHAAALYQGAADSLSGHRIGMMAGFGCAMYPNLTYTPSFENRWGNYCTSTSQNILLQATRLKSVETVLLVNFFDKASPGADSIYSIQGRRLTQEEAFLLGNGHFVENLLSAGKRVILVVDIPHLPYDPRSCIQRLALVSAKECFVSRAQHDSERKDYRAAIEKLRQAHPRLEVFDSTEYFCDNEVCSMSAGGYSLYESSHHLSLSGAKKLLALILPPS